MMTLDTYTFSGNAVTILGLVGVASTLLIVVTAFRRFFNSPYNFRVPVAEVTTEEVESVETEVS
jgi:hypothetical protein